MSNDVTHEPGADELRMRRLLRERGVGPDAVAPSPARPRPAVRPRDWLDDIVDSTAIPAAEPKQAPAPQKDWWSPLYQDDHADLDTFTGNTPTPTTQAPNTPAVEDDDQDQNIDEGDSETPAQTPKKPHPDTPQAPRQSLLDAWDGIRPRTRWLVRHATAAAAGWPIGLVAWGTDTAAWYAAGHWTSPSAWVLYGLGGLLLALYRRSRTWAWPAAWAAAIPVSSIVLGVLLYAPTA